MSQSTCKTTPAWPCGSVCLEMIPPARPRPAPQACRAATAAQAGQSAGASGLVLTGWVGQEQVAGLEARERQSARDKQEALGRETHLLERDKERDKDAEKERHLLQKRVSALEAREAELLRAAEAAMERERSMMQERSTALERVQVRCAGLCPAHRQLLMLLLSCYGCRRPRSSS